MGPTSHVQAWAPGGHDQVGWRGDSRPDSPGANGPQRECHALGQRDRMTTTVKGKLDTVFPYSPGETGCGRGCRAGWALGVRFN